MWLISHIEKDLNFESLLIISARSDHVLTLNLENNNVDLTFVIIPQIARFQNGYRNIYNNTYRYDLFVLINFLRSLSYINHSCNKLFNEIILA